MLMCDDKADSVFIFLVKFSWVILLPLPLQSQKLGDPKKQ